MKPIIDVGVLCIIVLMMATVGMEMEGRHFRAMARRKALLLLSLAGQALILPALGFGLTYALAMAAAIAVTLLYRMEYAVFAAVYFLAEVPLLLGAVAVYRKWRTPEAPSA